jgi:hypothetical protein
MQVPTGADSSETYVIDVAQKPAPVGMYDPRTDHKGWLERLPRSRELQDKLACDPHVAYYYSRGGQSFTLENPDEIPWVAQAVAFARMTAGNQTFDRHFTQRRMVAKQSPVLPMRVALSRPRMGVDAYGGAS